MDRKKALSLCGRYNIKPDSGYGQNFLCDDAMSERISALLGDDVSGVLEIGPGIGAITEKLAEKNSCGKPCCTAVEIDSRLTQCLSDNENLKDRIRIINADFLTLTPDDYKGECEIKGVISNIPYCVMTPVLKKLFRECGSAGKMVFMVEKDAVQRIISEPGTKQYGPLAVLCGLYGSCRREFDVSPDVFYPVPHTISSVISITKRSGNEVVGEGFSEFIEACFSMRRKKLANSLSGYLKGHGFTGRISDVFEKLDIGQNARAEELSPHKFMMLYNEIIST